MDEITTTLNDETYSPSDDPWTEELDRQAERRTIDTEADFGDDFLSFERFADLDGRPVSTDLYVAIFPIHRPAPESRHYRAALSQLPTIVPDSITITGEWTGHTWTDRAGKQWWVMSAPAAGQDRGDALPALRTAAQRIHPALHAWTKPRGRPTPNRLERLGILLAAGTSVEDAVHACGWARPQSAGAAARRAGNITLARTLEEVA